MSRAKSTLKKDKQEGLELEMSDEQRLDILASLILEIVTEEAT